MKLIHSVLAASLILILSSSLASAAQTWVYLVEEEEAQEWEESGISVLRMESEADLESFLQNPPPYSEKYERLSARAFQKQRDLVQQLEAFQREDFNEADPESSREFMQVVNRITRLIFDAPTEPDYFQRLFILNQVYLQSDVQEETRFRILHQALRDENLRRESRRRQIREILIGASSLTGATLGAYFTFKASQKVFPIIAEEKTLPLLMKWSGRGLMLAGGAGVGAAAGAYIGFLGSDYILSQQFDFFQPIDRDEDLTDLLDIIDSQYP